MGLDLDNEMKASYIDAEKAYWKFVAEPTVDPVALALRSVAAELRAARYTRREQPVEVNAIRLAQTDAVLDSPAGSEWVRASDYDTLKERADALADAVDLFINGNTWTSLVQALTAYREVNGE